MPEQGLISPPDTLHDTGGGQETSDIELHIRALEVPFKRTQLVQLEDGDLMIKGVPMLAEGTWTDSAVGTPLFYPSRTLEEYATNWQDKSGWIRHNGTVPRKSTDKVGEAENIRYESGAVTADVRVYGFTQTARDLQELIKRKLISFVSVEHNGNERYNPATRQMEASTLSFLGFAFVNKGACKKCRINDAKPEPIPIAQPIEEVSMETKELEAKIAALEEAVKAKPTEVKVEVIPKELSDQMTAMAARIKELESKPAAPVAAPVPTKELESLPEFSVPVDRKSGVVGA